ncbi:hypothetical protein AB0M61_12400 [Streptomyces sp. NPDC051642]|jgi:hypothetical protein|uniref:hypothetical protein n=1 Tax=Streptomyces sp. NPDC051642 TaxID=3154646 RepID=UPI00342C002B
MVVEVAMEGDGLSANALALFHAGNDLGVELFCDLSQLANALDLFLKFRHCFGRNAHFVSPFRLS